MTSYVALLRGVNLGSRNRLPMAELRELIGAMGGADVRTLLQSGNAVFDHADQDPAALAERMRERIAERFGLTVPCVVRETADLRRVVAENPFAGAAFDPARLVVSFLAGPVTAATVAGIDPEAYLPDEFRLGAREVYINCPTGLARSTLPIALGKKLAHLVATARNWNTVLKLAALADG